MFHVIRKYLWPLPWGGWTLGVGAETQMLGHNDSGVKQSVDHNLVESHATNMPADKGFIAKMALFNVEDYLWSNVFGR